jgi:spore germination protein GerM
MSNHKPVKNQPVQPALAPEVLPQPQESVRRSRRAFPLLLTAGCSAIALVAGSALAWWTSAPLKTTPLVSASAVQSVNGLQPVKPKPIAKAPVAPAPAQAQNPAPAVPTEQSVEIYWLKSNGNEIELAAAPVAVKDAQPRAVLKAAFEKMLEGSTDPTLTSTIPANTRIQKLEVKEDGIHVDLSAEFESGGGSTSMMGRVGQVVYTATTLDPQAAVWITVDDRPLDVLGGEGLVLDQPMTREAFDQNFEL